MLAQKVNGKLIVDKGYENVHITLTMLCYFKQTRLRNGKYIEDPTRKENDEDMDPVELVNFFKSLVEVKVLDMTKWTDRESENLD